MMLEAFWFIIDLITYVHQNDFSSVVWYYFRFHCVTNLVCLQSFGWISANITWGLLFCFFKSSSLDNRVVSSCKSGHP